MKAFLFAMAACFLGWLAVGAVAPPVRQFRQIRRAVRTEFAVLADVSKGGAQLERRARLRSRLTHLARHLETFADHNPWLYGPLYRGRGFNVDLAAYGLRRLADSLENADPVLAREAQHLVGRGLRL